MPPPIRDPLLNLGLAMAEWLPLHWPPLLVGLLGVVVARAQRHRHRRVALLAAWGFAILGPGQLALLVLGVCLAAAVRATGPATLDAYSFWIKVLEFGGGLVDAAALGLLVAAIFLGGRRASPGAPPPTMTNQPAQPDTAFRAAQPPRDVRGDAIRAEKPPESQQP